VAGKLSLKVRQLQISLECKTADNVFVVLQCRIQYQVLVEQSYLAFYAIRSPSQFIRASVIDSIRGIVPEMTMDQLFERQDVVSVKVLDRLGVVMASLGFAIRQVLLTHITPPQAVKNALNEAKAAERLRMAALPRAEAEKVLRVTSAQAACERAYLQGVGIANQRREIMRGLRADISLGDVSNIAEAELLELLVLSQYFNTLQSMRRQDTSRAIFVER